MSEIPDIEVARYALRTFNVASGRLMPVAMAVDAWKDGVCQAECVPNPWTMSHSGLGALYALLGYDTPPLAEPNHAAPADGCHCGIYGCLTIDRLKRQYPIECMSIVAVIAVEGNTIIGEIGLRTQAARIVAYWSPEKSVRKICAETCGEAKGFTDLDDMLAAFGFEPEGEGGLLLDELRLYLTPPSRPKLTRFGRILYRVTVAVAVVNLAFFIAGLFTSAEMFEQLANLGGAAICGMSAMLTRRNLRRVGA